MLAMLSQCSVSGKGGQVMTPSEKAIKQKAETRKSRDVDLSFFVAFLRSNLDSCTNDGGVGSILEFPPFQLMPQDYLAYATEAINSPTDANRINCIAHLKRAAECQADTFLHVLSLAKHSQTRNFPLKMATISKLNIMPARSLTKLNAVRNKMEHEYSVPDIDDLELYFDLVAGFVAALEGAIFMLASSTHIDFAPEDSNIADAPWFSIEYELKSPYIKCTMRDAEFESVYRVTPDHWDAFIETLRI